MPSCESGWGTEIELSPESATLLKKMTIINITYAYTCSVAQWNAKCEIFFLNSKIDAKFQYGNQNLIWRPNFNMAANDIYSELIEWRCSIFVLKSFSILNLWKSFSHNAAPCKCQNDTKHSKANTCKCKVYRPYLRYTVHYLHNELFYQSVFTTSQTLIETNFLLGWSSAMAHFAVLVFD